MSREPITALGGTCAWRPEDTRDGDGWCFELTGRHVDEIDAALAKVDRAGLDWPRVTADHFSLDTLADLLAEASDVLENGVGMVRISGLPVERYDDARLRTLWAGIGRHLGTLVRQNPDGQLMRPITDEGPGTGERYGQLEARTGSGVFLSSRARVASTGPLRFHTDRADVVALLCLRGAAAGGISKIASSVAVHDEMLRRRPDLVALLYDDIHRSRLGEEAGGEHLSYPLPVFGVRDGKFTSHYSRTYVEAAQMMPDVPAMSDAQWEALDLLAEVAESLCIEHHFEPGDLQFLNNHVTYHARTAYDDPPGEGGGRLLYRLWISTPNSRALPLGHEVLWRNIEAGEVRGGIRPGPPG